MRKTLFKTMCILTVLAFIGCSFVPAASADGCIAISYYGTENEEEREKAFSSIFETRQLARVEYKSASMQRISLFLSVYSLDPGKNISILVPLRTLPLEVTGEPIKEDDYRDKFKLTRVEEEVERQDVEKARKNMEKGVKQKMQLVGGSMVWTYPAEYTREKIVEQYSSGGYGDDALESGKGGGGNYGTDEPEPVQTYEFDGFSIEVYGVTAGPSLKEHLETKGLILPNSTVFDSYMDQYVAVIESEAKPPIAEDQFSIIQEFAPDTVAWAVARNKAFPKLSDSANHDLIRTAGNMAEKEFWAKVNEETVKDPEYMPRVSANQVENAMTEFIKAVFGDTNYQGEVVHMDVPLDNGKMYFPLGTSGGWPTAVGEIDVIFKVPEGRALSIQNSTDVFFEGSHYYWFHMENANPGFDLESRVGDAEDGRQGEMERAGFINDNWEWIGLLLNLGAIFVMWFATGMGLKVVLNGSRKKKQDEEEKERASRKGKRGRKGSKGKRGGRKRSPKQGDEEGDEDKKKKEPKNIRVFTNPGMWIFLGLSLIISVPGALLVYFIFKPVPIKELRNHVVPLTMMIMYPISLAFLIMGVNL